MKRILPLFFTLICVESIAQIGKDWGDDKQGRLNESIEANRSIDINTTFEKTIKPPTLNPSEKACYAEISVQYDQRNDKVQIEAEISNEECNSSYGNYIVRIKTADDAGKTTSVDYNESWSLENAHQKKIEHTYSMGGDVELISARIRGSVGDFCKCGIQNHDKTQGQEIIQPNQ